MVTHSFGGVGPMTEQQRFIRKLDRLEKLLHASTYLAALVAVMGMWAA